MRLQELGMSGTQVSRVGLGCNNFGRRLDLEGTRAVVEAALQAGITFLDTADVYGGGESERFLGEVLQGRREQVVLATKFGFAGGGPGAPGSRDFIRGSLDASLERLRTDYVDVYYYHRPDGVTPIAETIGALAELVEEGRVRAIGLSNVAVEQLDEAVQAGSAPPVQKEYSPPDRTVEADA